jgi:alpha-tubulin suppressor-like RCC1 family protein
LAGLRFDARPVRADVPPPVVDLWTFGRNVVGQLGSVPPNNTVPWPMHEARHWVAVSGGSYHTLALTDQGEVFAWGSNTNGQLGDGTTTDSILPVQVTGLTGVTLIASGGSYSLAYRASDRTLWGWGSNGTGQLAQPSSVSISTAPISIPIAVALKAVAAGGSHALALAEDGQVYAWGNNQLGQLGLGDVAIRYAPTAVPLAGPAIAVGAGSSHSLAVTSDGQAWTWGWNVFGQLGTGEQGAPTQPNPNPVRAVGVTGVDQVTGGDFTSLARTTDGHVFAWGYNTEGQVGNGANTPADTGVLTPVLLTGIDSVASVDAGGIHSIALRSNGEVWAWGNNQFGACGTNSRIDQHSPEPVLVVKHATAVTAGGYHSVVLSEPRPVTVLTQLGDPGVGNAPLTLPLVQSLGGPSDVTAVAAGSNHGLALDGQHRVWSWGDDSRGQLGTANGSHPAPALVDLPLDGAVGFVQVAARAYQSFALRSDGTVFSWGDNTYGGLGLGPVKKQTVPVPIDGLSHIVAIGAGEHHAIALDQMGTVWAWGQNLDGELGTRPSSTLVRTPAQIPGLYGITSIAAGGFHNAALDLNGLVVLWGDGSRAQLGNGSLGGSYSVVDAALPHDVTMVALGRFHSVVLRTGGTVWTFGDSSACQLGNGTTPGIWEPLQTPAPTNAVLVAAGDYHGLAVTAEGTTYGWGDDTRGALGTEGPSFSHVNCLPAPAEAPPSVLAAGGNSFSVLATSPVVAPGP